ncbi:MAG: polysaccharide deacetylase family protein [Cyclobacteriaceae bacterium]|nr:polysaccharide deacetylase family protein [Cyclobacteriaceae bacterium]
MTNKLIIFITDFIGYFLKVIRFDKAIRSGNDLRLVFYHGIGDKNSAAMTYLDDEIPEEVFRKHIDYLQDKYILLSLKDAVELAQTGKLPKENPVCAISFDDGLRSVFSHAFPLLKERGIPFDVFVNTSVIGNKDLLWLHAINYLLTNYGPANVAESINSLIDRYVLEAPSNARGLEQWCMENFEYFLKNNIVGQLFDNYALNLEEVAAEQGLYLTWEQIEEMSENGVGFYSHTHRHFPLNTLSEDELIRAEIKVAHDILDLRLKAPVFISFPFGMESDYGKRAIPHAFSVGHKFVVEVGDGLNSLTRIISNNIMSRVCLGTTAADSAKLYSAIEVRPVVKTRLKSMLGRNS